ncbi:MAG: MFS transporter [Oscillatoria sp. PMC 1051.18]|nr:MFS transporter [Oscillatoria sp. PMC 1050.18]MEC5032704.1 MFS transporter [Oscillatoria sp. PMC 1051.18]
MFRDPRILVLLAAGSLTTMAGGVVSPVLPEIIEQLQLDPALAGNLVSLHCLTIALFSPPLGILADRIGRLRILIPCLVGYAIFGTAGAFIDDLAPLLVARGLLGAASGGIAAASLGLLGSMYEGEARSQALGYATSTLTLAGIAFPLLGGWVGSFDWHYAFYLYAIAFPLAFLAALTFGKQPPQKPKTKVNSDSLGLTTVLGNPETLRLLLTLSLASIAMYAVVIYAPIYLKQTIGAGSTLNGIVLASRAVGAAIISAFGAKPLAKRVGGAGAIAVGFGLMALTLITIPLLSQLSLILVTAVFFGVGFGLVLPNLYNALANLAPSELRSSVLAAGTGAGFLGQFVSPLLLGIILGLSGLEMVFYVAAIVAMTAGFLLFVPRTSPPNPLS